MQICQLGLLEDRLSCMGLRLRQGFGMTPERVVGAARRDKPYPIGCARLADTPAAVKLDLEAKRLPGEGHHLDASAERPGRTSPIPVLPEQHR